MKTNSIVRGLVAALTAGSLFAAEPPSFKTADKNQDGKLDMSEFSAADQGRKGAETTAQMFTKLDGDGDKGISATEFAPYRIRREMAGKDDKPAKEKSSKTSKKTNDKAKKKKGKDDK